MSLPLFEAPQYTTTIPSTGETVKFRPFLVKEQKTLLMAQGADITQQIDAINQVITACTNGKVDVRKLSSFDAEYLFLQIRSRAVGENVEMVLTCECGEKTDATLDVTHVQVLKNPDHSNNIDLGNNRLITMRYPRLEEVEEVTANRTVDGIIKLIASSIDTIWNGDDKYDAVDYTVAELIEFVEGLSPADLDQVEKFFDTMPTLAHDINWTCRACDSKNHVRVEGIQNFFA
jgi:hypothetical protein